MWSPQYHDGWRADTWSLTWLIWWVGLHKVGWGIPGDFYASTVRYADVILANATSTLATTSQLGGNKFLKRTKFQVQGWICTVQKQGRDKTHKKTAILRTIAENKDKKTDPYTNRLNYIQHQPVNIMTSYNILPCHHCEFSLFGLDKCRWLSVLRRRA